MEILESLEAGCETHGDMYRDYLRCNSPRIVADANFVAKHVPTSAAVLDIGAIPPLLVALLHRLGYANCTVADPFPDNYRRFFDDAGIRALKGDLLNQALAGQESAFDLVCLNEVVEHLAGNLLPAVGNALACVKPGGLLMVTTPNQRSFSGFASLLFHHSGLASKPFDGVRAQFDRSSSAYGYFGHVREYTKTEVIALFASFGCDLVACEMQPNYLHKKGVMGYARRLEQLFPRWALFGKYLFRKRPTNA